MPGIPAWSVKKYIIQNSPGTGDETLSVNDITFETLQSAQIEQCDKVNNVVFLKTHKVGLTLQTYRHQTWI